MNKHLTEQQLIDYQFKLADEADLNEARAHLERCAQCRQNLERLVRKFATLDLLRGEIKASEDLLGKTVENATKAHRSRVLWLYRVPVLGAVAAAVIVGAALLLVSNSRQENRIAPTMAPSVPAPSVASAPALEKDHAYGDYQPTSPAAQGVGRAERAPTSTDAYAFQSQQFAAGAVRGRGSDVPAAPPKPASAPMGLAAAGPGLKTAAATAVTEEKPPFAPASAIELVVMPRRENVQLTIYNAADLTLVRERRNLTLKRGWNWLQFMWANTLIDPTSLALEPQEHKDGVQVQQLVFPPRLRELGRWLIHSEVDGPVPFELTYFTSGLAWRAFYMGTLSRDEKTMHLEGYVRVNNSSGEDYEDAQTRLVVGRVHLLDQIADLARRQYPYGSPVPVRAPVGMAGGRAVGVEHADKDADQGAGLYSRRLRFDAKPKEIIKEGLSEYFLYTIEGTETIPNQWGKRLLSFQTSDIPVASLYKYDEERWGATAIQYLSFVNDKEHKLGATPLPDGTVRIYGRADDQGHLSYVGAMGAKYIPVGEKVELDLGPARLVKVEPLLMDTRTGNYVSDPKGNIAGWDETETWQIKLTNTREIPVELEITRSFDDPSWELALGSSSAGDNIAYEKRDATHARFTTVLVPKSQRSFEYTVTKYRGARSEYYRQREKERSR